VSQRFSRHLATLSGELILLRDCLEPMPPELPSAVRHLPLTAVMQVGKHPERAHGPLGVVASDQACNLITRYPDPGASGPKACSRTVGLRAVIWVLKSHGDGPYAIDLVFGEHWDCAGVFGDESSCPHIEVRPMLTGENIISILPLLLQRSRRSYVR